MGISYMDRYVAEFREALIIKEKEKMKQFAVASSSKLTLKSRKSMPKPEMDIEDSKPQNSARNK